MSSHYISTLFVLSLPFGVLALNDEISPYNNNLFYPHDNKNQGLKTSSNSYLETGLKLVLSNHYFGTEFLPIHFASQFGPLQLSLGD